MHRSTWPVAVLIGALAIAAVSTLGDVLWFEVGLPHTVVAGLAHGTLLFLAVGLYLGVLARRPLQGAVGGAAIGFVAAGSFYVFSPLAGRGVMFAIWMALWFVMAALRERLVTQTIRGPVVLARGSAAAVLSGVAFYAISGIWSAPPPGGRNYLMHFASWTVAYLPAFAALLYHKRAGSGA